MKNKTPKTIADLDINWTFDSELESGFNTQKKIDLFKELNPEISNLVMKSNRNIVHCLGSRFYATALFGELLSEYMSYLNLKICCRFTNLKFKLSHFERISDTEYVIHGN